MKKYFIFTIIAISICSSAVNAQNYTFSTNLLVGSSGSDVVNLQTWLISNSFDIPAISSGIAVKGHFGSQTKLALIKYQKSLGFPAFGYFGPMTRGYINGHTNPNNASFKVTSPNGGEVWVKGTTQNITWNGSANVLAQKGDIKLEFPLPACAEPGQPIRCMIMVRAPITVAKNVDLNLRSYSWYVGNQQGVACIPEQPSACEVSPGQYKVQICPADGSACAESVSNFTISATTVNTGNTPIINGVDAPTTLSVGQTGTWTIHATDPLNGTLSYQVNWGDVPTFVSMDCLQGYTCDPNVGATVASVQQASVFTHSYKSAGTYKAKFFVRNSSGQTAQVSSTVTVTGSTSAGPLKITSPNGGEVWTKGITQNITWTSPYYLVATTADLKLIPYQAPCTTQVCPLYMSRPPYTIATNIPVNQNSYSWNPGTVQTYFPVGADISSTPLAHVAQYSIQICETGTSNCDSSDQVFTLSQ